MKQEKPVQPEEKKKTWETPVIIDLDAASGTRTGILGALTDSTNTSATVS